MFDFLKKKKNKNENNNDKLVKIPEHVAIIMDGNGRWAKKRNLPRIKGHYEGMQTVKKITKYASNLGVKHLTLYAFSTENWSRPEQEVNYLMSLPKKMFDSFMPELIENNIKVSVIGDIDSLPADTKEAVSDAINKTKDNTGLNLIFALNYGSRLEILSAVKNISNDIKSDIIKLNDIDEDLFSRYLNNNLPDPDLLIRTSGEQRISNFLLWQIAYSEFIFTDVAWPDFNEDNFYNSLLIYQKRDRRFGGLNEN